MGMTKLGSDAHNLHIFVMPATHEEVAEDLYDGDPPTNGWVMCLTDPGNMHELSITGDSADDLGDFIARLTVQAATAMRASGVDLTGRIHASLVVAGLLTRSGQAEQHVTQPEGIPQP
jgi:hypothetical protein